MNKTLLRSVREYKKQSVLAPLFVILEVLMEVLIPMEMAKIIDVGIAKGNINYIVQRGLILVVMAMLALWFGVIAGKMAAAEYQITGSISLHPSPACTASYSSETCLRTAFSESISTIFIADVPMSIPKYVCFKLTPPTEEI